MPLESGFFRSLGGDRKYLAEFFTSYFGSFIGNGVFPNPSNNLQVLANTNLTVTVNTGKGWINGNYLRNTTPYDLTIAASNGTLNRIDRIVFATNADTRQIEVYVKQGTLSANPVAPTLRRDATVYELALADIRVNAGTVAITQADITDLRPNAALCGIVSGTVNQVDVTTLYNQYATAFEQMNQQQRQQFNDFIQELQDVLSDDVAGNLLNMINALDTRVTSSEGRLNTNDTRLTSLEASRLQIATNAEAIAGTNNTKAMTPLRVNEAITNKASLLNVPNPNVYISGYSGSTTRVFTGNYFPRNGQYGNVTFTFPKLVFAGIMEVKITSQYAYANSSGGARIVYHLGFDTNTIHSNQMDVLEVGELFANNYTVSTFSDTGTNYTFSIEQTDTEASNGMRIEITFKGVGEADAPTLLLNGVVVTQVTSSSPPTSPRLVGINKEINDLKFAFSNGIINIAGAVTEKGVTTASDANLTTIANNIRAINTGVRFASGTYQITNNYFLEVGSLPFRPSSIVFWDVQNQGGQNGFAVSQPTNFGSWSFGGTTGGSFPVITDNGFRVSVYDSNITRTYAWRAYE